MARYFWIAILALPLWFVTAPTTPPVTNAQADTQSAIVCRDVTLRTDRQTTASTVITQLAAGTTVELIEHQQFNINMNWSYIRVDSQEGWVASGYLTVLPRIATVRRDNIVLYQLPFDTAAVVGSLSSGDQVEVLGREEDFTNGGLWAYVRRLSDNSEGWVLAVPNGFTRSFSFRNDMRHLMCQAPILYERPHPRDAVFWPQDTSRQVSVYDDPYSRSTYSIADVLDFGDTVTITGQQIYYDELGHQNWVAQQVTVNNTGISGWVTYGTPLVELPCQTVAKVPNLLFYDRLAVDADPIGSIPSGTPLTVISVTSSDSNAVWMQVSGEGISGWVAGTALNQCPSGQRTQ